MGDLNDVFVNKFLNVGEYDIVVVVKLLVGWVLMGEFCEVCVMQVICNW